MSKLDQESFQALKEIMEEEFVPLLELYIKDSDARFIEIQQHVADANCSEIRHIVHSFKGASSNVCAVDLSRQAQIVEDSANANLFAGLAEAINSLHLAYLDVRAELLFEIENPNV